MLNIGNVVNVNAMTYKKTKNNKKHITKRAIRIHSRTNR